MLIELRCAHTMHGIMIDDATIEVKCRNSRCGARSGVVVLHMFSTLTGELLSTQKFKDPEPKEVTNNGTQQLRDSLRSA